MGKNVAVFVDVANIFYAAKAAGVDIDYVTLLKSAIAGRDFVRAYAYTGLDPDNENQRNFHNFLARHGYKVVSKDIRKYGDGKVKANLDIELVVDMMKTARNLDVAIVVSGDGDFAPAIRAVQEMGVRVEVISFRGNTSSDLIDVADLFTDIIQLAKVEKGSSRSGRRVADDGDGPVDDRGPRQADRGDRPGRGRGTRPRPRSDRRRRARARRRDRPVADASTTPPDAVEAEPVAVAPPTASGWSPCRARSCRRPAMARPAGQAEVFSLDDLDDEATDAATGPDEPARRRRRRSRPRRRRRRGGARPRRGRGRGRGRRGRDDRPRAEEPTERADARDLARPSERPRTGRRPRGRSPDRAARAATGRRSAPSGIRRSGQSAPPSSSSRRPFDRGRGRTSRRSPSTSSPSSAAAGPPGRGGRPAGRGGGRRRLLSRRRSRALRPGGGGGGINRYPDVSGRSGRRRQCRRPRRPRPPPRRSWPAARDPDATGRPGGRLRRAVERGPARRSRPCSGRSWPDAADDRPASARRLAR